MSRAIADAVTRAQAGGAEKYHQKLAEQGKLFVRERLRLLLDEADGFAEEGLLVQALAGDLPADAVVTGVGSIHSRPVAVMANDPTVKAGSWGPHTVEKIIRIIESARRYAMPIVYLVDSAGAYIPAFCDVVFMQEQNASMYLGSPRMAEEVIGERVTLEEMGGARMHCEV